MLSIGTTGSHVLTVALYSLQWDLMKDLEPIALLVSEPLMIVGRKGLPAQDLKELIAWLKANPDKASQGHAGVGATGHITGVIFQRETNTRFEFVPYRGGGPALQDLVAGQTDLEMEPCPTSCSRFAPAISRPTRSQPRQGRQSCRTYQLSMRLDCPDSIDRFGSAFGCPRGLRRT